METALRTMLGLVTILMERLFGRTLRAATKSVSELHSPILASSGTDSRMDDRREFLLEMYRQMFADINRHMTVVWQAVSVVVGAFAILALVEKNIIPIDLAVSLIVILC